MLKPKFIVLKSKLQHALLALVFSGAFLACEEDVSEDSPAFSNAQRAEVLTNWADNYILPGYASLEQEVSALHTVAQDFESNATAANLSKLRKAQRKAWMSWTKVAFFRFGPGDQQNLRENVNTFPCDTAKADTIYQQADYNLEAASKFDIKGFPTLDYLLYPSIDSAQAAQQLAQDQKRLSYITALCADMEQRVKNVHNEWKAEGGDYRSGFISRTGTDVGSSMGQVVNGINWYFERVERSNRIGLPNGNRVGITKNPYLLEAPYSRQSLELAQACNLAFQNFWAGNSLDGQTEGQGLDDYLDALEATSNDGATLSAVIAAQFTEIDDTFNLINTPLYEAVQQEDLNVDEAYKALQQQVIYLKVDMPSEMGIQITYADNDGD